MNEDESKVPPVISVTEARALMSQENVVVADVRWYTDGRDGRQAFLDGHIPGAIFVDVDHDLADHANTDPRRGRHPLPSPEDFARRMAQVGIGDHHHVIAYDDTGGMTAARLVVMLRMIGRSASLLNGGLAAWTTIVGADLERGETPSQATPGTRPRTVFTPAPWPTARVASIDDMRSFASRHAPEADDHVSHVGTGDKSVVIDARAPDRFEGRAVAAVPTLDPRPGHIPGARNAPWAAVLDPETGLLRSRTALQDHFTRLGIGRDGDCIAYCGSGVSACLNIVALEHAGLPPARLFVPSWSGWASDPDHPAAVGPAELPRIDTTTTSVGIDAVHALRRARQRNRLADIEWFEALYRVYLAAFVFGGSILFISGLVPDDPVRAPRAADIAAHGPAWLGLAGVLAVAMGLRSGSRGGPLAVETADVRHVLLAPVSRWRVLLRPAIQRLRTVTFATAGLGAVAGQLAGRRLPGSTAAWALAGAAFGATVGLLFVAAALVSHGMSVPHGVSSGCGVALLAWQMLSAVSSPSFIGPGDRLGSLAFWGQRTAIIDIVCPAVALLVAVVGTSLLGRQSLEALSRRSALVAQLRFAVTLQDLRTVALLRRQLSHERCRTRPWIRLRRNTGPSAEWHRAWQGILRFPASRLARLTTLSVIAGLCVAAAYNGTTAAIAGIGLALFIIGLELLEPLAQETDQGDRTEAYPELRGSIHLALVGPSFVVGVFVAMIMVISASLAAPDVLLTALIVSWPAVAAGIGGAAINIVAGAPDQLSSTAQQNMMPSEVAGTVSLVKAVWPVVLSTAGALPLVGARVALTNGSGPEAAALRIAIAVVLGLGLVIAWIRFRDDIKAWLNNAATESRRQSTSGDRR